MTVMSGHEKPRRTTVALAAAFLFLAGPPGAARADDGRDLLKAMSDYMAAQQSFSFSYQSSVGVVTDDFQKLQFVSSGTATVSRPDKIRVTRTGGFANLEVVFDGHALSVLGKNLGAYARLDAKGTLDDMIEGLDEAGAGAPGADLLSSDVMGLLTDGASEVRHVASAYVNGTECEYVTLRKKDVDLQIWIEAGDRPVPRRYVITTKHVAQAPEYILEIADFETHAASAATDFRLTIPEGARQVDLGELEGVDELPTPTDTEAVR